MGKIWGKLKWAMWKTWLRNSTRGFLVMGMVYVRPWPSSRLLDAADGKSSVASSGILAATRKLFAGTVTAVGLDAWNSWGCALPPKFSRDRRLNPSLFRGLAEYSLEIRGWVTHQNIKKRVVLRIREVLSKFLSFSVSFTPYWKRICVKTNRNLLKHYNTV